MVVKEAPEVTYIGAGVLASYDGDQIWLQTSWEGGWHWIALDAAVFFNLVEYAKRVWPAPDPMDDARQRMLQDRHEAD